MTSGCKLLGLALCCTSIALSCTTPKPGEKEVEAWAKEHPDLWKGAVDYDSLQVLVEPDAVRDSIEGECYEVMHNIVEYMDTSRGDGKFEYQSWAATLDSINHARPKVQIGWKCHLGRGEPRQLTLFLDMAYQVDSAYEWSGGGGGRIFPLTHAEDYRRSDPLHQRPEGSVLQGGVWGAEHVFEHWEGDR